MDMSHILMFLIRQRSWWGDFRLGR